MNFDELIDRRESHSMKWDMMEQIYGVPKETGLAMWVADMDFQPPVQAAEALRRMLDYKIFGYFGDHRAYHNAICWWMQNRHGWNISPDWIFPTHGAVNAVAMCMEAFTQPGDGVVLFTPVYHSFARITHAAGRQVVECRLEEQDEKYTYDFDAYNAQMTGRERIAILCSPHNPGGRVWSKTELQGLAAFCERHDLILIASEVHHDLVYPNHCHPATHAALPEAHHRMVIVSSITKTFNLAGSYIGNIIVSDEKLREKIANRLNSLGIKANSFGLFLTEAVYSPDGAAWVDALVNYLDGNRRLFDERVNAIPGIRSMPLEATYLAWVDFRETGLTDSEVLMRIEQHAEIAVNRGATFGSGGEGFARFNLATPRSRIEQAVTRLEEAFN